MLSVFLLLLDSPEDESKFERIYNNYEKRVFSIAYYYTEDFYDSEEVTQTTFFSVAKNLHKIDESNVFATKTYIYTIAKNAAFTLTRKRKNIPYSIEEDGDFPEDRPDAGEILAQKDELETIVKCIKSLPEIYRDTMVLFYINSLKIKEIAFALDTSESTVKTHLARGRKLLEQRLEGLGVIKR